MVPVGVGCKVQSLSINPSLTHSQRYDNKSHISHHSYFLFIIGVARVENAHIKYLFFREWVLAM